MSEQQWSSAIKAADPMGFYSTASAAEVAAAREAGIKSFETSEVDSAFKADLTLEEMKHKPPSKELLRNLCDASGRTDPKKMKEFASMLSQDDPWRKQIEALDISDSSAEGSDIVQSEGQTPQKPKGECEGSTADGKTWRWEQTEAEILIRFTLAKPATKKEVKVAFKVSSLAVTVAGVSLFESKLHNKTYPDECTWSLAEVAASEAYSDKKVLELQVLLSLTEDEKWPDLCAR